MPQHPGKMENGKFSALMALCEGNQPATGGFSSQRPVTRSFDVFFDMRINKRLIKQTGRRRFETPSYPLLRHYNEHFNIGASQLWCFLWMCLSVYLLVFHVEALCY